MTHPSPFPGSDRPVRRARLDPAHTRAWTPTLGSVLLEKLAYTVYRIQRSKVAVATADRRLDTTSDVDKNNKNDNHNNNNNKNNKNTNTNNNNIN